MKKLLTNLGIILLITVAGGLTLYTLLPQGTRAATVHIQSTSVFQGDPVMITVTGTTTAGIHSSTIEGAKLHFFDWNDTATALYGIDLEHKIGTTSISILFSNGSVATTSFVVKRRARPQQSLPIPQQLGGNSPENQQRVVSMLEIENRELARIANEKDRWFFDAAQPIPFTYPVAFSQEAPIVVTNAYGYNRESGYATIPHKGTDFRAATGTPVYAIAGGIVRAAKPYIVYGDTVVIDHGAGILSMYMHMSSISTRTGDAVERGQIIGWSGNSGYSEGAHLHLSIRINGISIDPMKFFALFNTK